MPASLTVSVPPCPSCGTTLVVEGDRRTCPRCGRIFTVAVSEGVPATVYRHAPAVVDLVPVRDRAPLSGLRIERRTGAFSVSIGGTWLIRRALKVALAALIFASALPLVLWVPLVGTFLPLILGALLPPWIADALTHRDQLTVGRDSLLWQRFRGIRVFGSSDSASAELARVTGVRDAGDHIRIDLDDGTFWEVGKGLKVPCRARRWVAGRIAQLLPSPADSTADDSATRSIGTGADGHG